MHENPRQRAQLWAIYFGIRALSDPPPFLARTRDELKEVLDDGPPPDPTTLVSRGRHLRRVK